MALCYYVFGEDWELSMYMRQKSGFSIVYTVVIYHFQLFLVFNRLLEIQSGGRIKIEGWF